MLRLVFAAMAIHHDRGGPFLEWLAERIRTRYSDRDCLHDARAAALLRARIVGWQGLGHHSSGESTSKGSIPPLPWPIGNGSCAKGLLGPEGQSSRCPPPFLEI